MLTHLHIRDFAIVPALELDFECGFTAITGETGAGKSILVDALGLLLGDRSDSSWVRPGAGKAELSAAFDLGGNAEAGQWLDESGLGAGEECVLRRVITANGRSRAWINGSPVTVQQLGELGNLLVELHGQNEHIRLTSRRQQLRLLDACGDYAGDLESTADSFAAWKALEEQLRELEATTAIPAGEREFLQFQLAELQAHALDPADLKALESEHRLLARGGELLDGIHASLERLDADPLGAGTALQTVLHTLAAFEELDPDIADARRMLQEAAINCQEAAASLRLARDRVDLDPGRLRMVGDQLGTLGDLSRKHQVPMERLTAVRDQMAERLDRAENFAERRARLAAERDAALAGYRTAARRLSKRRAAHAGELSSAVTALMADLGMPGGRFDIELRTDAGGAPSKRGDDDIELQVSANPGMPPGSLAKIASGGELSRISLAIKAATSRGGGVLTQVFDEVDAGIGGDTANAVGNLLRRLSQGGQALCVTHLAQVAVCAGNHLLVRKQTLDDATQIDTALLDEQGRVNEIARMLSGRGSQQSRAHAAELLASVGDQA
jgi:DNA repair protein RecN (Recombination protein N)